jgi:hypothetical protein
MIVKTSAHSDTQAGVIVGGFSHLETGAPYDMQPGGNAESRLSEPAVSMDVCGIYR